MDAQGKEVPGARGYKYFGRAKELPGVKELFQPPRKFYCTAFPVLCADQTITVRSESLTSFSLAVMFFNVAVTLKEKTRAELHRNVDADYYGYRDEEDGTLLEFEEEQEEIAMQKALEDAQDGEENGMQVDGQSERTQSLGTLYGPSQKEVEEYLVKRRKQAILDRFVSDDLVQSA